MPRKLIKRFLPTPEKIKQQKSLHLLGDWLNDPNLWHINRVSVSKAFAVGLFMAFVPLPSQMIMAAAAAVFFRCNLPLSVALVWITNPITMPVIFYGAYKVGALLLNTPIADFEFELTWQWLGSELARIWQPFLLGCFVSGIIAAVLGKYSIDIIWRLHIADRWKKRCAKRQLTKGH
jgi:uncharacterized protein (DUF2062 family)